MKYALKDIFFFIGLWFIGRVSLNCQADLMIRRGERIKGYEGVDKPLK